MLIWVKCLTFNIAVNSSLISCAKWPPFLPCCVWVFDIFPLKYTVSERSHHTVTLLVCGTRASLFITLSWVGTLKLRGSIIYRFLSGRKIAITKNAKALMFVFHWIYFQWLFSRLNDVSHCKWSGGFRIDQDDSFHVNMRFAKTFQSCSVSNVLLIQVIGVSETELLSA